jgi:5-methylcytosine-specific restriction endonuclease McrA
MQTFRMISELLYERQLYYKQNAGRLKIQRSEWYKKNNKEIRARVKTRYELLMTAFREWKLEKGCTHCGYANHPDALQIDHIEPLCNGEKSHNKPQTWNQLKRLQLSSEVQVLCANCHAIKTADEHRKRAKSRVGIERN